MNERLPLTKPVYVTKYWETRGILQFDPCEDAHFYIGDTGTRYFCYKKDYPYINLFLGPSDYFLDLDRAQDYVRTAARRRLKALDKKRAKLEAIAMDGVKVSF